MVVLEGVVALVLVGVAAVVLVGVVVGVLVGLGSRSRELGVRVGSRSRESESESGVPGGVGSRRQSAVDC